MVAKIQQLDKTVLTEITVQVADIYLRQKHMKAAVSAKVPQSSNFVQADANVSATQHVTIPGVSTVVIISCWSPILLDLTNASGVITGVPCTGLFINYGQFDSIVIRSADVLPVRISYLYA